MRCGYHVGRCDGCDHGETPSLTPPHLPLSLVLQPEHRDRRLVSVSSPTASRGRSARPLRPPASSVAWGRTRTPAGRSSARLARPRPPATRARCRSPPAPVPWGSTPLTGPAARASSAQSVASAPAAAPVPWPRPATFRRVIPRSFSPAPATPAPAWVGDDSCVCVRVCVCVCVFDFERGGPVSSPPHGLYDIADAAGNGTCAEGYSGFMCSLCDVNYYRLGERCRPCGRSPVKLALIAVAASVAFVAILVWFNTKVMVSVGLCSRSSCLGCLLFGVCRSGFQPSAIFVVAGTGGDVDRGAGDWAQLHPAGGRLRAD